MAEPDPANGPDPAPDNQQPQGNPAAADSVGADDFLNSQVNMVYQDLQGGRSLFFIAWVFCCVGSVVMLIPLAFLVMPLISGGTARVQRAGFGGRRPPTPRVTLSTAATRIAIPTFTIPPRQTVPVPADCRRPSPTIEVNTKNMKNNSFKNGANAFVAIPSGKQVYCVYNISRVRRTYGFDFLLNQFPWPICPNVIYWSLGVNSSSGHLFSRAPELDSYSGFYNITSAARDYSPDTKVLFTLGGYPEDSVLFLLLGNETLAQNNLLQMVIAMLYRLQFNGLNIHLSQNPHCEQYTKFNLGGLQSFIVGLREMVHINGPIDDFKITVMVDTNEDLAYKLLLLMRDLIDVVFLDTYRLFANNLRNSTEFCLNYGTFLSKFKQHTSVDRLFCYSFSTMTRTWNLTNITEPGKPLSATNTVGYGSFQDICDTRYGLNNIVEVDDCDLMDISDVSGKPLVRAYFFTPNAIQASGFLDHCVLLDSVDYGVHPTKCSGGSKAYILAKLVRAFRG